MRRTPLQIKQAELPLTLRGYSRSATDQLLEEVADDYEAALWQRKDLRDRLAALEAERAGYEEQQRLISATLVHATRLAGALEREARRRARKLVKRAQSHADAMTSAVECERDRLLEEAGGAEAERDLLRRQVRRLRLLAEDTRTGLSAHLTAALERIQAESAAGGDAMRVAPAPSVLDDLRPDLGESALWTLEEPPGSEASQAGTLAPEVSTEPG